MTGKRYQIKQACPQCGCSAVSHLSKEEMADRFGDVPNVEMECLECMEKYQAEMQDVCPEWDKDCRMNE